MQFTFAINQEILSTHSNATRYQQIAINVGQSWPHFSWPTLYIHFSVNVTEYILVSFAVLCLRYKCVPIACNLMQTQHEYA